jgi:hypothetical protein
MLTFLNVMLKSSNIETNAYKENGVFEVHGTKACRELEVPIHSFLMPVLDTGESLASCPGRLIS